MDDGLKQRLVGAIVLVALAVIFLPQLFDQETPYQVVKVPIPQPPASVVEPAYIEQQRQRVAERQTELVSKELASNKSEENELQDNTQPTVEEQVPVELITDDRDIVVDENNTAQHAEEKTDTIETDTQQTILPSLDQQGVPVTWTLQLATFGNRANADKLLRELRAAGYKAYSKQVATGQKSLTRVYVGPSLSKDSVIQQQQSIAKRWSLSGLVMRFKP
ncbi:SPOR domain-containing protein [Endozoicomonas sp. SM1973]|uniref:SPOR domain-containing protein n=1 Tax=Spartinivicinus marinus TaxID=2994442 RepID=A0A853HXM3_9GAMM|nr:SPOR domain-containing protein [Spartinivicinus marinus]MCX4024854.1 SPOR domain-containing protein [Spartinivicinus marinus]NYZ66500.1 SPOR domain-containing protein [Spartinivicinus marinus]